MDALVDGERLIFGGFCLEPRSGRLLREDAAGHRVPVPVGSRTLDILRVLLNRLGAVISKDAIMDAVWPDVSVETNNLTVHIAALRRVLDDGRNGASCIQTVPGRGYRFVWPVTRAENAQPTQVCEPIIDPIPALKVTPRGRWPADGAIGPRHGCRAESG